MNKENKLIVILGPTASGKTKIAACIASHFNGEIISADSRQVYKDMNLGTGKDYSDYMVDGKKIPYHLVDIKKPGEKYNVYEYQKDFINAYQKITERNKLPILCGGTGMYIDAVTKGYKLIPVPANNHLRTELNKKTHEELKEILDSMKKLHNITDFDTKKRTIRAIEIEKYYQKHSEINTSFPTFSALYIGIKYTRENERKNITIRLRERMDQGMIEEVQQLLDRGLSMEDLMYYGLEYKFIPLYLNGEIIRQELFTKLNTAIHQFAKRQRTWFRKMEREGNNIHWIEGELPLKEKVDKTLSLINKFLRN